MRVIDAVVEPERVAQMLAVYPVAFGAAGESAEELGVAPPSRRFSSGEGGAATEVTFSGCSSRGPPSGNQLEVFG